ncbi:MAG: ribonuclease HII [Desulfobacterales bacterium]|nr:ribonuclease HII [Desulfobacterales bacterium]
MWKFETEFRAQGFKKIAGVDEAGRGPLAGPVVSAAVILPDDFDVPGVNDSKKLTPRKRDKLYDQILEGATTVGVGIVDNRQIDQINILRAALLSMAQAAGKLNPTPDFLLIDGTFTTPADTPQKAIPRGDSLSISIAAASIIAKVTRDRLMADYHIRYPEYGFDRHKGYPTKAHKEAIARCGITPIHRLTFKGVKEYV